MTTHSQVRNLLRNFLDTPDDPALRTKVLRYLAHAALREMNQLKRVLDEGFGDRDLCPRCWGTGDDEINKTHVDCRVCGGSGTLVRP